MKAFLRVILLLALPLALIVAYTLSDYEVEAGSFMLERADLATLSRWFATAEDGASAADSAASVALADTAVSAALPSAGITLADSAAVPSTAQADSAEPRQQPQLPSAEAPLRVSPPDSTKFRILFFGDSMLEGLAKRMCDYTMENGYELTSVIWYSSSTQLWAETDTLQFFLRQVKPYYVVLCLGSNELFVRDLAKRERYISTLVDKLTGYPFVWISPPNWKPDTGINQLIIDHVGQGRYFDSRSLELERASDHAHPTRTAAAYWMDTIASWMSSPASLHPLRMNRPTQERPRKYRQYMLKPVR